MLKSGNVENFVIRIVIPVVFYCNFEFLTLFGGTRKGSTGVNMGQRMVKKVLGPKNRHSTAGNVLVSESQLQNSSILVYLFDRF